MGVIAYWEAANKMRDSAVENDRNTFLDAYKKARNLGRNVQPLFQGFQPRFTDVAGSIELLGRHFANAHKCLFDTAMGIMLATWASAEPGKWAACISGDSVEFDADSVKRHWSQVRRGLLTLPEVDMREIILFAEKEHAAVRRLIEQQNDTLTSDRQDDGTPSGADDVDPPLLSPDEANRAARDRWLYEQRMRGKTWFDVYDTQRSDGWNEDWSTIGERSVISAVMRYAKKNELPLPKGRGGRPAG